MKIPKDAAIAPSLLASYLPGAKGGKSSFAAPKGWTAETLGEAVRRLVSKQDARVDGLTPEGVLYRVTGKLTGAKGSSLAVVTFWLKRRSDETYSFVRMESDREGQQ